LDVKGKESVREVEESRVIQIAIIALQLHQIAKRRKKSMPIKVI